MESVWGLTLHHIDDLDFNPNDYLPHIYGKFRERNVLVKVRPLLPTPKKGDLPFPASFPKDKLGKIPTLKEFGFND